MVEHVREEKKRSILQKRADLETKLEAIRQKERKVKLRQDQGSSRLKKRKLETASIEDDEDQFVLDDYESDGEQASSSQKGAGGDLGLSKDTQALMQKLGYSLHARPLDDDAEPEDELKIFFCSRTHSQLTQFVGELRRIKLPPAITQEDDKQNPGDAHTKTIEELKHLTLGSRKNLCINPKVTALRNPTAINERCLELQDSKTPADKNCPYVPNKDNEAELLDFQHHTLSKIRDIEDLGAIGLKLGICPYYATRPTVKPSEIVTLPYPLLLQKTAREALGLSLKDHVIIIDEAHNLMDAILGIYTVEVSLAQLQRAREQLTIYLQKFRNKLKGKNRVYVTQVIRLLDSLSLFLQTASKSKNASGTVQAPELLQGKGVDQINLYKLMHYLRESKLARKVEGYVSYQKQTEQTTKNKDGSSSSSSSSSKQTHDITLPVLTHIQSFFQIMTNPEREGRFFHESTDDPTKSKLKYLLLDPSEHFREIVEDARAVILAGGTMSPMDDYKHQLFPYLDASRLTTLSCGHVIPASNLFVSPILQDMHGAAFDFTFASRNSSTTITSLGETLINLLPNIPDGTILFFPSHAYLSQVVTAWKTKPPAPNNKPSSNPPPTLWSRLAALKPIFQESRGGDETAPSTEETLASYTKTINEDSSSSSSSHRRGALLLAVIGGKLSEGINFSDRLGRCILVVGLPYPNPNSPEWKAKMEYIEQKAAAAAAAAPTVGSAAGRPPGTASREFAENVCMRAVNQAIGRAVRHRGDWAAILLVDVRYGSKRIEEKLPKWIRAGMRGPSSSGVAGAAAGRSAGGSAGGFDEVKRGLCAFFEGKKGVL